MNSQLRLSLRFQFLIRSALAVCFSLLGVVSCSAQSFDGGGDGSSWHDARNWNNGAVPSENNLRTTISPDFGAERSRSVQLNSPGIANDLRVGSSEELSASLSVNARLSVSFLVSVSGRRGFLNVNADISAPFMAAFQGGTLNLNSGTITSTGNGVFEISDNSSFNQNGGHFNVREILLTGSNVTLTVGPNDNITEDINVDTAHLILDRPISLTGSICSLGAELTINHDLSCDGSISISGQEQDGILNWNAGVISTPSLQMSNVVLNRTGNGHLDVGEFVFTGRTAEVGPDVDVDEEFIIREDDLISGPALVSNGELTIESPHAFETLFVALNSVANYQQEPGEKEGLTVDTLRIFISTLNLGFDSQSAGGSDWVLRTAITTANDLEEMIEDGEIVVTGAEFEVVNDPATGFTYIQAVSSQGLLGDVDLSGAVDFADIPAFIAVLIGGGFQAEADCDQSGVVDFSDIPAFIEILIGS